MVRLHTLLLGRPGHERHLRGFLEPCHCVLFSSDYTLALESGQKCDGPQSVWSVSTELLSSWKYLGGVTFFILFLYFAREVSPSGKVDSHLLALLR